MDMYIRGEWMNSARSTPVTSPYSGDIVDEVPDPTPEQIEWALSAAEQGAAAMGRLSAYERSRILRKAADLFEQRIDEFARIVSLEQGKPLTESRGEAGRIPELLRLCAYEGSQLRGETLPLDAQAGAFGKIGLTFRVPCGVVLAITPCNYPLLLVAHKIGPALAAGNAVIVKPSNQTPLSALHLTEVLLEAGLPELGIQCVTGAGSRIGAALCADPRIRKITFTGSTAVGEQIARIAGIKKLSLELGSNCPLIVLADADIGQAADAVASGGYVNAGQVCISAQRVIVERRVYADFIDALRPRVESLRIGDPLEEATRLSAMTSEREAERVEAWIREAVAQGARAVTGGQRERAVVSPAIVAEVRPDMRLFRDELFGPAVAVTAADDVDEAIRLANDSKYGLGAGIFTRDLDGAFRFAQEIRSGQVMVNWSPLWRADFMPYGGVKQSGFGTEGPRYAIQDMTDLKCVVFHGRERVRP